MKRSYSNREYVLGGLFALMALFPFVTPGTQSSLDGMVSQDTIERAFSDRAHESTRRRLRWSVLRDCAQRETAGEENVCPDMNDFNALRTYWVTLPEPAVEDGSGDTTLTLTVDELGSHERHILRRARRNGQCPADLDEVTEGLAALCEHEIGTGDTRLDLLEESVRAILKAPRAKDGPSTHYRLMQEQE